MAHGSGTIASATPAEALITAFEGVLNTHDNYDFVEEVVAGTQTWRVWKNRGSGLGANAAGADYHFAFCPFSATALRMRAFENWDTTGKKAMRPVRGSSTSLTPNADGSWGDTTTGYALDVATNLQYRSFSGLNTTGFDWFMHASKDRIWMGIKQSSLDSSFSLGHFESIVQGGEANPLYFIQDSTLAANEGSISPTNMWCGTSRMPGAPLTAAGGLFQHFAGASMTNTLLKGGIGNAERDHWHGDSITACRFLLQAGGGGVTPTAHGLLRGYLRDTLFLVSDGSARTGDTITLGGEIYWAFKHAGGVFWSKRSAA